MPVTKKEICKILDKAQLSYSKLFDDLLHLKNFKRADFNPKAIIEFQHKLGLTLYHLSSTRFKITSEEKNTIGRKNDLSKGWFRKRMICLKKSREAIDICINIGKSLGDAFIWHFYMGNRTELFDHLEHQDNKIPPIGIGGQGELEFIRSFIHFENHIVLLHSNTSLLRIGDVSFISLKDYKVSALGEIKTERGKGTEFTVRLTIIGSKGRELFDEDKMTATISHVGDEKPKKAFDDHRYKRQINKMGEYFGNKKRDGNRKEPTTIYDNYHFNQLTETIQQSRNKQFFSKKISEGLLYVAQHVTPKKVSRRAFHKGKTLDTTKYGKDIESSFLQILSKTAPNFKPIFGYIHTGKDYTYEPFLGGTPIFWAPMPSGVLKKIYLQEVLIMSIYNPTFLFEKLKTEGIEFIKDEKTGKLYFGKKIENGHLRIDNYNYFLQLISRKVHSEEGVISAIKQMITLTKEYQKQNEGYKRYMFQSEFVQDFDAYNTEIE